MGVKERLRERLGGMKVSNGRSRKELGEEKYEQQNLEFNNSVGNIDNDNRPITSYQMARPMS